MTSTGAIWSLRHEEREIARLTVTGTDFPWVHADVETLPGFDEFRSLFAGQEQAIDEEDHERADTLYARIRAALTVAFPDGQLVPEFMLHVHGDGTAGWRWHDEPFETGDP
jgi:hypothetical protein